MTRPCPEVAAAAALAYAEAKRAAWAALERAPVRTLADDRRAWRALHAALDIADHAYRAAVLAEAMREDGDA